MAVRTISLAAYSSPYSSQLFLSHLLNMIVIITTLLLLMIPYSSPLQFNYPKLEMQNPNLTIRGNASYLGSEIQLTPNQKNQIGRLTYFQPMQLWEFRSSSGNKLVTDFTTQFSFTFYPNSTKPGDGMAFFLAQPALDIPEPTYGEGFGLVRFDDMKTSAVPFVAIEFDTFKNLDFDPIDLHEHVGINVNSMVSREAVAWPCNFSSSPKLHNATISYNFTSKTLSVIFTGYEETSSRPIEKKLSYQSNLADYLPERVVFGFSAANGYFTLRHVLLSWSFSSEIHKEIIISPPADDDRRYSKLKKEVDLVVGLTVGALALIVIGIGLTCVVVWRKDKKTSRVGQDQDSIVANHSQSNSNVAKKFSRNQSRAATNNFVEEKWRL